MTTEDHARVTIVVPTYRRPVYLAQCLASICAQTYTHFVVTVCDNSPDREGQAVVEALHDARFRYVPRSENLGLFGNAVRGLAEVRTELVMELDDDDILLPDCLATLVSPFGERSDLSIAFGHSLVIDENGDRMSEAQGAEFIPATDCLPDGFIRPFVSHAASGLVFINASVIRHDAVDWQHVPEEAGSAYDRYIALAAARHDRAAFHTSTPVLEYRVHSTSDSQVHPPEQHLGALYVLSSERLRTGSQDRATLDAEILRTRIFLARSLLASGQRAQAWRHLVNGLWRREVPRASLSLARVYGPNRIARVGRRARERLNSQATRRSP